MGSLRPQGRASVICLSFQALRCRPQSCATYRAEFTAHHVHVHVYGCMCVVWFSRILMTVASRAPCQ
jgi:hypothetical protein